MQVGVSFDEEVDCGGKVSKTIQVGNISIAGAAANGDVVVDPLPADKTALGWVITTSDGKVRMRCWCVFELSVLQGALCTFANTLAYSCGAR